MSAPVEQVDEEPSFNRPSDLQRFSSVPPASRTVNLHIFRAAVAVTIAGTLVKLVATAKEYIVAGAFGRSDDMDAFLMAFVIPGLLINLFAESMNQALIPTLIRVSKKYGREIAEELFSSTIVRLALLLSSGSLLLAAISPVVFPMLVPKFAPAKLVLTEHLFLGLLPLVLLTGIASNCAAVINTVEQFWLPALVPILTPLSIAAGSWLFAGKLGIWVLVYANLLGALLSAAIMILILNGNQYRFRFKWRSDHTMHNLAIREVADQYGPVLLSGLVASAGLMVDQAMAATLPSGSISALAYANRFVGVVLTLLAGAISTAMTPYLSRLVAQRDWASCRHTINTYVKITSLISLPIAVAFVVGSPLVVRVTLQHGAFVASDTATVAPIQAMYAIQIPFFIVSRVFYRFLVAMRRTSIVFYCGVINLALDVLLNILLTRSMGVAGIALATSLWTVSTFLFLGYWTYRLLPTGNQPKLL